LYSAKKNGKIKKTVEKRTHADAALESDLNFADAAAFFFSLNSVDTAAFFFFFELLEQ